MPNLDKILLYHIIFLYHLYGILSQSTFVFNIGALKISVNNSCKKSFISEHMFIPIQMTSLFQFA